MESQRVRLEKHFKTEAGKAQLNKLYEDATKGDIAAFEKIKKIRNITDIYNNNAKDIPGVDYHDQFLAMCYTDLGFEYLKKHYMVMMTAFMYRSAQEYGIPKGYDVEEVYPDDPRPTIMAFLDEVFKYNPERDIQCSYKKKAFKGKDNYDEEMAKTTKFLGSVTPSIEDIIKNVKIKEDVFCRVTQYQEQHYDEINKIASSIYHMPHGLRNCFMPLCYGSEKECTDFLNEHNNDLSVQGYVIPAGAWCSTEPVKGNRDNFAGYGENQSFLKDSIAEAEKTNKMLQKFNENRVINERKENEAREGKIDPSIKEYAEAFGQSEGFTSNVKDTTKETFKTTENEPSALEKNIVDKVNAEKKRVADRKIEMKYRDRSGDYKKVDDDDKGKTTADDNDVELRIHDFSNKNDYKHNDIKVKEIQGENDEKIE